AVVAFTEPPVHQGRHARIGERDPDRLDGPREIRCEDHVDPVVRASAAPSAALAPGQHRIAHPGRQPVTLPRSLSSVVEWVSKTTSIGMHQPYGVSKGELRRDLRQKINEGRRERKDEGPQAPSGYNVGQRDETVDEGDREPS